MALFGRDAEPETPQRSTAVPSAPRQPAQRAPRKTTLIAAGAHLTGEISGDTDVLIEGTVEGHVHPSQDVTVGENGVVRGEIEGRRVQVAGKVIGNVHGKESVELLASANLEGDVAAPSLVIGDGAFFKGRVEMTSPPARAEEPKAAAKPSPSAPAAAASPSSAPSR